MTVRVASAEDLALLPAVETAADEMFDGMDLPPAGSAGELAAARLVLVAGDPPAGFARVEIVDGLAHLEQLSVHPEHGRRGLGGALVEAACAWAAAEGFPAITLITFADVPWNAPFYARHGFEPLTELTPGLGELRAHEGELGLDALGTRVVMRRELR
ncbi:GNAT family N-acetyltransferase [Longispora albida]|uniref:GNAT family N-acetyltransferase n=1 Tax=Longispora albida TaxID=203523 RepID=UPI00036973FB|nr:GNAT family N-acetyltransferase [Longispora albida]